MRRRSSAAPWISTVLIGACGCTGVEDSLFVDVDEGVPEGVQSLIIGVETDHELFDLRAFPAGEEEAFEVLAQPSTQYAITELGFEQSLQTMGIPSGPLPTTPGEDSGPIPTFSFSRRRVLEQGRLSGWADVDAIEGSFEKVRVPQPCFDLEQWNVNTEHQAVIKWMVTESSSTTLYGVRTDIWRFDVNTSSSSIVRDLGYDTGGAVRTPDGDLWLGTERGLVRIRSDGRTEALGGPAWKGTWRLASTGTATDYEVMALPASGELIRYRESEGSLEMLHQFDLAGRVDVDGGAILPLGPGSYAVGVLTSDKLLFVHPDEIDFVPGPPTLGISAIASLSDGRLIIAAGEPTDLYVRDGDSYTRFDEAGSRVDEILVLGDLRLVLGFRAAGSIASFRAPELYEACAQYGWAINRSSKAISVLTRDPEGNPLQALVAHPYRQGGHPASFTFMDFVRW